MRIPFILVALLMSLFSLACANLPYTDAELAGFRARNDAVELAFTTRKGRQVAYYLTPQGGRKVAPRPLVVSFPGIGSRALERLDWADKRPPAAGMLLVDYPDRGQCEGLMRPKHLPDSFVGAMEALKRESGLTEDELTADLRIVGHSFGTAVALEFALYYPGRSVVLLAPFTTLRRAMWHRFGPLAWILPDNLHSLDMLQRLCRMHPGVRITIIHGTADKVIPVTMGRELRDVAPARVELHEREGGTHTSVLGAHDLVFDALLGGRPEAP